MIGLLAGTPTIVVISQALCQNSSQQAQSLLYCRFTSTRGKKDVGCLLRGRDGCCAPFTIETGHGCIAMPSCPTKQMYMLILT